MRLPRIRILGTSLTALVLAAPLCAQLEAHFTARSLDYNGNRDDCDLTVRGLPTCELCFMMGIFPGPTQRGDLFYYPAGCGYHSLDDGVWEFTDPTIDRPLPDLTGQASVLFTLFHDDPADDDDLLGTHLSTHAGTFDGAISGNNNSRPSGPSIALDNPQFSDFVASSSVAVDLRRPTTSITDPPAGSWHSANFDVSFNDFDANLDLCEIQLDYGPWMSRSCNAAASTFVGQLGYCSIEGTNETLAGSLDEPLAPRRSQPPGLQWRGSCARLDPSPSECGTVLAPLGT